VGESFDPRPRSRLPGATFRPGYDHVDLRDRRPLARGGAAAAVSSRPWWRSTPAPGRCCRARFRRRPSPRRRHRDEPRHPGHALRAHALPAGRSGPLGARGGWPSCPPSGCDRRGPAVGTAGRAHRAAVAGAGLLVAAGGLCSPTTRCSAPVLGAWGSAWSRRPSSPGRWAPSNRTAPAAVSNTARERRDRHRRVGCRGRRPTRGIRAASRRCAVRRGAVRDGGGARVGSGARPRRCPLDEWRLSASG
jgi:hypothetical protein